MKKIMMLCLAVVLFSGCAVRQVRQSDLDAWKDVPVEALDTHSFFLTLPMVKTITDSGVEIRVYSNKVGISRCAQNAFGIKNNSLSGAGNTVQGMSYQNFNSFQNCSSQIAGCDAVFYIRDGRVLETKPVGKCYTDDTVRPEPGWERFTRNKP